MSEAPSHPARALASPALVLCRQCAEYVFAGTTICPHCGGDAREIGPRYRDGNYAAIEALKAIERIESTLKRRSG